MRLWRDDDAVIRPTYRISVSSAKSRSDKSGTEAERRPFCRKKRVERAHFCRTLGIYEVFLQRSGRKIWVRGEPSPEPYIPCYTPRTKRSVVRAQRGRSEAEKFKKYFSFSFIRQAFFINYKFDFFVFLFPRRIRGKLEK